MKEIRCFAPAVHYAGEPGSRIEFLYDVISVRLIKRCELSAEQAGTVDAGNMKEYWLFELGPSRRLPAVVTVAWARRFRFRLTSATDMLAARTWDDLPDRYQSVISTGG